MHALPSIVHQVLWHVPMAIVWIIGLVSSILLWRRHPRVSLLAAIAFTIQLALQAAETVIFAWIQLMPQELGILDGIRQFFGPLASLLYGVAMLLLVTAVFWGRWRADRES